MRVTNGMIRNNMLSSLHTNMSRLDTLYNQMNTLKKIQRPSDDPIVAGRSLKLRINVLEVEQYKSNTDEAKSWMEITEQALKNINGIAQDIRTRCNNAATGTLTTNDRDKLKATIDQLWQQLQDEANVTYIGRSVFTGYKTDEPVVLTKETKLTEDVTVEKEMVLLKGTIAGAAMTLPDGTTLAAGATLDKDVTIAAPKTISEVPLTESQTLPASIALPTGTIIPTAIMLPNGTPMPGTPAPAPAGLPAGITVPAFSVLPTGTALPTGAASIESRYTLPTGTTLPKGTINPKVLGKVDGQEIQYEVGVGSSITVNTLGMDSCMSKLLKDVKEIKDGIDSYYDNTTGNEVDLHELFNGKIGEFDKSLSTVSEMTADLGSRMIRIEYTATRLVDDKANFTELLSNTENVDLEDIYVDFNSQYAVYQSALQATSKVIMNTLADFLR